MCSPLHSPWTGEQENWYIWALTAILRCYVDYQQVWDAYTSALTYTNNSQVHCNTHTGPFIAMLNRKFFKITLKFSRSSKDTHAAAKQPAEVLVT